MQNNILVTASALSDQDLLARLETLAGKVREASVELVAHLAVLDSRPALFLAQGYGSLFSYCTQALRLSEDATCNTPHPIVQAWAPERYRVQFTIGQETHEKLRRLQELLRREIPDGDPGAIFDRPLTVLLDKVEKTKLGAADKPRPNRPILPGTDPSRSIRPGADKEARRPTESSWRHSQYEAELIFGPHGPSIVRETQPSLSLARP